MPFEGDACCWVPGRGGLDVFGTNRRGSIRFGIGGRGCRLVGHEHSGDGSRREHETGREDHGEVHPVDERRPGGIGQVRPGGTGEALSDAERRADRIFGALAQRLG